nr:hypothetical protein [Nocardia farcinica]
MRVVLTVLAVVVAGASGCSSTVTGTAVPGLFPVDPATLRTGGYVPEPTEFDPDIDGIPEIRLIEARRMLGHLVHSVDVDPEIHELGDVELFWNGERLAQSDTFPAEYQPAAERNGLVAGVYVSRTNGDLRNRKKLIVSVLRFPTQAASRQAALDFDAVTGAEPNRHPVIVADFPEARTSSADDLTAISYLAHDVYLVVVNAGVPQPNPEALAEVTGKTLELQIPALDEHVPIPLDDLLDIPADPDGIMRRALPAAAGDPFYSDSDFGALTPDAQLHFERKPAEVARTMRDSGVDLVGRRGGVVYRTEDLPAAFRLQTTLSQSDRGDEELPSPPGLDDVRCLKLAETDPVRNFNAQCVIVYGRYVAVVFGLIPSTARIDPLLYERAAAQYAILAESE